MTDQKQSVGSGAEAYQAKGNITINHGATPEQMSEIIVAITNQLMSLTHEAKATAEARYDELKKEIIEELSKDKTKDNSESFRDPDYQYVLGTAFESYARKGDAELKKELVRLLMERASRPSNSRMAYVLNESIRVSGRLTSEDRAVLVSLFAMKNVVINATNISAVYARYQSMLSPYSDFLPTSPTSFEYLAAIGCITIELVADHYPLGDNLSTRYANLFPTKAFPGAPMPGQTQPHMLQQPAAPADVLSGFVTNSPAFAKLNSVWESGFYRHSALTAVGKALAHSILSGDGKMDAALEVFLPS